MNAINADLKLNPYLNQLEFNSLRADLFLKDSEQKVVNPYQKPLALYLRLLKMFCMPGATVLDLTFGTGSLELAAMEPDAPPNLRFIAFEENQYQAMNGFARLQRACVPPTSEESSVPDVKSESQTTNDEGEIEY